MRFLVNISFSVICVIVFAFCNRPPQYSDLPEISFNSFVTYPNSNLVLDSIKILVNFKDGDGDLGTDNNDANGVWQNCPKNYLIDWWLKKNGKFEKITSFAADSGTTFDYNGNFPVLNDDGKKRPLEGVISMTLNLTFIGFATTVPQLIGNDTVKYSIYIKDRACNSSNVIETDEIVINQKPLF